MKNIVHIASQNLIIFLIKTKTQSKIAGMAGVAPMWPGFDSRTRRHVWVVGSRPCSEGFCPGSPVFLPPQKTTFPNSNSTWNARSCLKTRSRELFGALWVNKLHVLQLRFS